MKYEFRLDGQTASTDNGYALLAIVERLERIAELLEPQAELMTKQNTAKCAALNERARETTVHQVAFPDG